MHLSEEMVRQPTIVIETTQVRAADIAHLQLLVTRRSGGILKILQFSLTRFLLVLGCADLVKFVQGLCDGAGFAQHRDLEETRVDGFGQVGDLLQLYY